MIFASWKLALLKMPEDPQKILNTAVEAAQKAGAYLLETAGNLIVDNIDEKRKNDFVTIADKTSETLIVEHIQSRFPQHSVFAEESGEFNRESAYQWIIDPLDGTTNFIRNIPFYSISIAVKYQNQMLAGVVSNPPLNEVFTAIKGQGAFLNNKPIKISQQKDFSRAFLATGFPHQFKYHTPQYMSAFSEIFFNIAEVRRLGSAALDLCYTACARFEGFWELGLNPWDVAAGSLIVQEAGGAVSDFYGRQFFMESGYIVAANKTVHSHLIKILSNYFKER